MNKLTFTITFLLLGLGLMALFGGPRVLKPEPVLVLRTGIGASIFFSLLFLAFMVQIFNLGRGIQKSATRKTLQKTHTEYEHAHRQFIRRLDHEMKNPLTGLQVTLANLEEVSNPKNRRQSMDNALRAVKRIRHLLQDLRKLSELDSQALENRVVDVPQLVDEMVAAVRSLPANTDRQIKVWISQVPSPLPAVRGDRDLLGLALYNLLDNALKFTCGDEMIEIRVREDGRSVFIEVADTGSGIPIEDQGHIFKELYRGANSRGVEGGGLGLSLVKRIVELHHGTTTFRSRQDQTPATVFTIQLPIGWNR